MVGSGEHGNERLGSVKGERFLDQLPTFQGGHYCMELYVGKSYCLPGSFHTCDTFLHLLYNSLVICILISLNDPPSVNVL
jgi:hypothetical protein